MSKSPTTIIRNLTRLMEEKGTSPKPLAKAAGLGETAIYDILKGRNRSPRHDTLTKIAECLDVDTSDLTNDDEASGGRLKVSDFELEMITLLRSNSGDGRTPNEKRMLAIFSKLSDENQEMAISLSETLLSRQKS